MYDISVFPKRSGKGMFKEAEIMVFTRPFLEAMEPLIDPTIGMSLLKFFDTFENSPIMTDEGFVAKILRERVQLMHEVLDKRISIVTVHKILRQNSVMVEIKENCSRLSQLTKEERKKTLDNIDFVLSNEDAWIESIPPRTKEDYEYFLKEVAQVEHLAEKNLAKVKQIAPTLALEKTDNLTAYVKISGMFYQTREKAIMVNMKSYRSYAEELKRNKHGLIYQDKLEGTSVYRCRKVLI